MSDAEAPRFTVLSTTGYPIHPSGRTPSHEKPILCAVVYDTYYQREIATFRSTDIRPATRSPLMGVARGRICACGGRKAPQARRCRECHKRSGEYKRQRYGLEGALLAAAERCAELNAWHEREGWGEDVPLAS